MSYYSHLFTKKRCKNLLTSDIFYFNIVEVKG